MAGLRPLSCWTESGVSRSLRDRIFEAKLGIALPAELDELRALMRNERRAPEQMRTLALMRRAILLLGLIVAREMGWPTPPALRLAQEEHARFAGLDVEISPEGVIAARGVEAADLPP